MVKKQLKDSARTPKRHIERRPAGQPAAVDANAADVKLRYPVPQPRPIPRDHPARDIFRKENLGDPSDLTTKPHFPEVSSQETSQTDAAINSSGIPTAIPIGIPTAIPEIVSLQSQTAPREADQASSPKPSKAVQLSDAVRKKGIQYASASPNTVTPRPAKPLDRVDELTQAATTPLDATHTASEKIIYSIMYRETISRQVRERHFGPAELMKKSGIRSRNTVHQAIYGLTRKLSIEVVSKQQGNSLGPRYRVYRPQEVEERRRRAGIFIDEQTKKITDADYAISQDSEEEGNSSSAIPTGIPTGIPADYPSYPKNWDSGIPKIGIAGIPKIGIVLNSKDSTYVSDDPPASSSSNSSTDDDHKNDDEKLLDFVEDCYVRTTGNEWTPADAATVLKARDVSAEIWGIAICYCVDRAPDHKFARLAYVVEEARRHAEEMKDFSTSDLRAILGHSRRLIEHARSSGAWQRKEVEDAPQTG